MSRLYLLAALSLALLPAGASADETSATDKLRILYSTRFTFTESGVPLITVEIAGKRKDVKLRAKGGVTVRPDGNGGSAIENDGGEQWTITAEATKPAVIQDWTASTLQPEDDRRRRTLARWSRAGSIEVIRIGTVFGVDGEVIDTREVRIAIDPVAAGKGAGRAADHAKRFGIKTQVHQELVRRPAGIVVAKSGSTIIRNPSVLWFTARRSTETLTVEDVPTNTGGSQMNTGTEDRRY
jgi:hypothetical protein